MLRRLGCEIEVVTSARHDGFDADVETIDDIRYHRTARPKGLWKEIQLGLPFWREKIMTAAMSERLAEVVSSFRPDLIHAHSPFFNGRAALRVARQAGIPVVYEIRAFWEDDAVDKNKISEDGFVYRQVRRLEEDVVRRSDRVVCICEGLRRDLESRGIDSRKITVVKNGVESELFTPRSKESELAERYGLAGKRVLGFIGSFFYYEGLPELIECAARLREARDDFKVLLVGSGEDAENARSLVASQGLDDVVIFTGRVPHDEIQDHYALVDVFVYPRRSKRLTEKVTPLKPLEAMAMERVCVGSDVGGISELFDECGVGTTYRSGDADDMDRMLTEVLDRSSEELADEGRAGREAVIAKRHWERTLEPVIDLYRELMDRDGSMNSTPVAALGTPSSTAPGR